LLALKKFERATWDGYTYMYIRQLRIILTTMADLCRSYALLGVPYSCLNSSLGGWGIQRNTWVPFSREMSLAYVAAQCHCCFESSAL